MTTPTIRPLRKPVRLSTGKLITHTRELNGSQSAWPEMTAEECKEYDNLFAKRARRNQIRRDRNACYADLGLRKVRGTLGGTYFE